jgi:GNAT superfamily N-acetyltransferase
LHKGCHEIIIKKAVPNEILTLIHQYPGIQNVICTGDNAVTLLAFIHEDSSAPPAAFLSAFFREIPAPLDGEMECFVNVIEVFDRSLHGKGIGSALVQEIIKIARNQHAVQVRAYCDINNKASHKLWLKNGFGISPVKHADGSVPGSFVTYRIFSPIEFN